jgi:branched-chain amino acid transport system substrate-binding protein
LHLRLSRRGLLRVSLVGLASGGVGALLSACSSFGPPPGTPVPAATAVASQPTAAPGSSAPSPALPPVATAAPASPATPNNALMIGLALPFLGADAADASNIRDGALMAIDQINSKGGIGGKLPLTPLIKDNSTVAAGQYDPLQAATNMQQFVADPRVIGVIGPQMSGSARTMAPIASQADLVLISPSVTDPTITDPHYMSQYRPAGPAVFFRTVSTDAYQGPGMANFAAETLHVKGVYVLDDSGAYGVGIANDFAARAKEKGINVLGHESLDPRQSDYTDVLTSIRGMNADGLYYGGVQGAGVKLARQAFDVLPAVAKLGGDGMYSTSFPSAAGPMAEGWYATIPVPDAIDQPAAKDWVQEYRARYNVAPTNYALTAYDTVQVLADALNRLAQAGTPITRPNVRAAVQATKLQTLQGLISFDQNGDVQDKTVSVFQVKNGHYVYVGPAPTS